MSRRTRPGDRRSPIVRFEGVAYEMHRDVVLEALVQRQVEGKFRSREEMAGLIGCSRSTVSRWMAGRNVGLQVTLKVLDALELSFAEVFTRWEGFQVAD